MRRIRGLLLTILALCAAARFAGARSIPAYGGKAWVASEASCFSDNHGSTTQNCSGGHYWFIPLDLQFSAYQNTTPYPVISVYKPSSQVNLGCQTFAVSVDLLTVSTQSGMTWANVPGTQTLWPGPISVPGHIYHTFVWCYMEPGTRVNNVNW